MIVSVASGKGGTGKTLIATSLALSLKDEYNVQLLDCDVEEPNDHIFMKPELANSKAVAIPVPEIDKEKCTLCGKCTEICVYHAIAKMGENVLTFIELCHGCGACSYLCPEKAITEIPHDIGITETGKSGAIEFGHGKLFIGQAMAPPITRQVKQLADKRFVVITDTPPGTSCPVVEAIKNSDYCLLVTEPTPFGLNDLVLAIEMVKEMRIPCGVILNRADVGDDKTQDYCTSENIPILMTIPLDINIASLYSRGIPLVEGMPEYKQRFVKLYEKIKQVVY